MMYALGGAATLAFLTCMGGDGTIADFVTDNFNAFDLSEAPVFAAISTKGAFDFFSHFAKETELYDAAVATMAVPYMHKHAKDSFSKESKSSADKNKEDNKYHRLFPVNTSSHLQMHMEDQIKELMPPPSGPNGLLAAPSRVPAFAGKGAKPIKMDGGDSNFGDSILEHSDRNILIP